ncbi:hypothetical protein GCM10012275_58770 [Longimycelium tulufanense]|uniref:Uncharacterized protein n=1 Tax=Longimycelium tulufanense TaxID=907463 RepID=A0A8J3FXK3_9PSEU|nr:hypothetical protein [Longimycelium tulufanense]GGM80377.1 hypothetical protein GCM10012275_58770 [Longimycelium tulufanense]
MSEKSQSYDPRYLVEDVMTLLTERGLRPNREGGSAVERHTAASMLLRNLGITPAAAPEDWLDLDGQLGYNRLVHGD